jgi:dipeptidyl aminopeptidase/acylaminoacyl peptidase
MPDSGDLPKPRTVELYAARCGSLLLIALLGLQAQAPPADQLIEQLSRTVVYKDIAISPDGQRLAWVQSTAGARGGSLHLYDTGRGRDATIAITGATHERDDNGPAWSPDSRRVAFISNSGADRAPQLWLAQAGSTQAAKLADLRGFAERPRWSPDGKRIAFLYIEGAGGGGPLLAAGPQTGVIDTAIHNQRIAVADAASGAVRMISPADRHVYDFDWSPDGLQFAATAAPGPGDNNWWIAQLYVIRSDSGDASVIYQPKLQIATPRWSPDGRQIAFIEGLMSDEGFHGGDLYTISASGGAARDRMAGRPTSASSLVWQTPEQLLFTEYVSGGVNISTLDLRADTIEERWRGAEEARVAGNFPNMSVARDGITCGIVRSSFEKPPEVWWGKPGAWQAVTHGNSGLKATWGESESIEWSSDGHTVQGWLIKPAKRSTGKMPLVVQVHGGPSGLVTPGWPARSTIIELLASSGYYVLLPNPRGSYGRGEVFTQANVKDFGYGDLRDILAGVDAAIAKYPIDERRLGITGWSYGGYMTMFAVTQTTRFAAAAAGAGIANWTSYYGENLIDRWMIPFFGATVYEDPEVYAKSSPIQFIKRVRTPTLVVVGEQDAECPAPQSFEFWHALKTLGVPTKLVVYPGEGHSFVKPADQRDVAARMLSWFDSYLKE